MQAAAAGRDSGFPADDLSALIGRMRELERRVSALEQQAAASDPGADAVTASSLSPIQQLQVSSEAMSMTGFALLGIAGAYLLRALAEMGTLPQSAGVAVGIAYAAAWLWLAARTPAARRFAVAVRVGTSILIFAPLVWEAAVRFKTLPVWPAAAIVCAFSMAAETVSWRKNLKTIAAMVPAACALLALALLLGTFALAPFTLALLVMAAAMEFAALEDRGSAGRWVVAACSDLAALALALLLHRAEGLPEGYAPVSVGLAAALEGLLLAIYVTSAGIETLAQRRRFGILGIAQTAVAYATGLCGVALLTGWRSPAGFFALLTGAACYLLASRAEEGRNRTAYAIFALLLLSAAPWLALAGAPLIVAWCALAVTAAYGNVDQSGDLQAAILLWLAIAGSGVASGAAARYFTAGGAFPVAAAGLAMVAGSIAYCHARNRIPAFFLAAGVIWPAMGLLSTLLRFHSAPTVALILAAIALAWAGAAKNRPELVWLMYGLMAAAGLRILTCDLPTVSKLELVGPLLLFGAALILLPRVLRSVRA